MDPTMIDAANEIAASELAKRYFKKNRELEREIARLRTRIEDNSADVEISRGRFTLIREART